MFCAHLQYSPICVEISSGVHLEETEQLLLALMQMGDILGMIHSLDLTGSATVFHVYGSYQDGRDRKSDQQT